MDDREYEDNVRQIMDDLGLEYEPPVTDEERAAFKRTCVIACIGYACWIGLGVYWFGG